MNDATDEQRRLLDELRKLACDINEKEIRSHSVITLNQRRYNMQFRLDMNHDWLNAWHAELERIIKAIEATLGPRTCHAIISDNLNESEGMGDAWADCSECGHLLFVLTDPISEPPNYCPNCGRRIVEVD